MNQLPETPVKKRRNPFFYILGGCAVISLCIVAALVINAVYWTARIRSGGITVAPTAGEMEAAIAQLPQGSAERGEAVFNEVGGCEACHSLEAGENKVGSSLAGMSARSAETRPGYSAQVYLYESIVYPGSYVVEGYPAGMMPDGYAQRLTPSQLADLLAFLLAQ